MTGWRDAAARIRPALVGLVVSMAAAAAMASTGCGRQDVVEITLAHVYGNIFGPIHERIIAEFVKQHPGIRVRLEAPYPEYEDLVQRTRLGITQGAAPTISFQGLNQIRQFVDEGQAYDLTPFTNRDARWQANGGYYPEMMKLGKWNGRQYAIPFAISTPIVYMNVALLRNAGVDPDAPPSTWDGLIQAALAVQAHDSTATGLYYDYLITGNWGFQALIYSEGGRMMSPDESRVAFNDEAGRRATRLLRRFVDAGVMKNWNRRQAERSFISGKVGLYITSASRLKGIEDKVRFELRTATFPSGSTGIRAVPTGGNAAVIITDDPVKARAAYEYAMFAAGPIGTAIMARGSGYMPVHAAGAATLQAFYAAHPNYQTSAEQLPHIFQWYAFPGANQLKVIVTLNDALQRVVARQAGPDEAIDAAAGEVQLLASGKSISPRS